MQHGGIFINEFITNYPYNMPVKKFWKSANFWLGLTFLGTLYM